MMRPVAFLVSVAAALLSFPFRQGPNINRTTTEAAERLLETASSGAGNLPGVDRAYAYWLISRGFAAFSVKKERAALEKSCEATIVRSSDVSDEMFREKIQFDCLRRMMTLEPKAAAELVARAAPNVRQQIFAAEAAKFASKGDVEAALTMLSSEVSQGARYPYEHALGVIKALPADDQGAKDRVFAQALAYYREKHRRFDVGMEDLGTLIIRMRRDLSPGLVLAGIDELLDVSHEEVAAENHLEITLSSGSNAVAFPSLYQYRLFQLLPIIREFDPQRADDLLKQNPQANSALQKYGEGLQSFSSSYSQERKDDPGLSMTLQVNAGPAAESAGVSVRTLQIQSQTDQILATAQKDAENALGNALLLQDEPGPSGSPKAELLLRIAQLSAQDHPRIAVNALQELSKLIDQFPVLTTQCRYLIQIANGYLLAKRPDLALTTLSETMKRVKKLYASDTNSDDPNQTLKSTWPSTVVSRACVALAGRVSSKSAEEMILELPDPDLRVYARIERANGMLGVPSYPAIMQERHKQASSYRISVFPIFSAKDAD
jgi:hypothetical protein